jgi:Cu(I)/Ag(I) efflux system protein CusF
MNKSIYKLAAAIGFAALAMNVYADQGNSGKGMGGMKMDCMKNMENMKMDCMGSKSGNNSAEAASMSEGVVRSVDKTNKSIILKHGPIKNLHMGPMTMAFAIKDPALLSNVKEGDKVKFTVENVNDIATVTSLAVQK